MKLDKKAAMGEGVFMIYRLVLVSVIAFTIFGISSIFYSYDIEVRDAEAVILTRQVSECLSPEGVLDLDSIPENSRKEILSHCGYSDDRFYVGVEVLDGAGNIVAEFSQGDSGAGWVRKLTEDFEKYKQGYSVLEYPILIGQGVSEIEGKIKMEVGVSHEF